MKALMLLLLLLAACSANDEQKTKQRLGVQAAPVATAVRFSGDEFDLKFEFGFQGSLVALGVIEEVPAPTYIGLVAADNQYRLFLGVGGTPFEPAITHVYAACGGREYHINGINAEGGWFAAVSSCRESEYRVGQQTHRISMVCMGAVDCLKHTK